MWRKRAKERSENMESGAPTVNASEKTAVTEENTQSAPDPAEIAQQEAILEEILAEFSSCIAPPEAPEIPDVPQERASAAPEKQPDSNDDHPEKETAPSAPVVEPSADSVTIPFQARKAPKKHKKLKIVLLLLTLIVVLAGAVAVYFYFRVIPAEKVILSQTELTLREGETLPLRYTLEPSGADNEVTWRSSAEHVATVRNGVVTAIGEGSCTVTATASSGAKGMCRVTVRLPLMEEEKNLLGEWKLYATSDLGRIKYYYGSAYSIQFYSDRTGYLTENGETINFEWEYEETVNGYETYTVDLEDGRTVQMERNTNTGDMMNNTLTLRFSDALLWVYLH